MAQGGLQLAQNLYLEGVVASQVYSRLRPSAWSTIIRRPTYIKKNTKTLRSQLDHLVLLENSLASPFYVKTKHTKTHKQAAPALETNALLRPQTQAGILATGNRFRFKPRLPYNWRAPKKMKQWFETRHYFHFSIKISTFSIFLFTFLLFFHYQVKIAFSNEHSD